MKTISEFVALIEQKYGPAAEFKYVFPTLYIIVTDSMFSQEDSEIRQLLFMTELQVSVEELAWLRGLGLVEILLVSTEEREREISFLDEAPSGHHWMEWMGVLRLRQHAAPITPSAADGPRAVHFYGYKGGQARSTFLTLLAKYLADEGLNVLIVDADVEAPSLDSMLDVAADVPQQTLMGLCGWAEEITPIARAYVGPISHGTVDLLACRPRTREFDIDFAAFALKSSLDARTLQNAAEHLRDYCTAGGDYDVVFFDHRTGITNSVLPIVYGWPGPAVLFIRPDGTTRLPEVASIFRALLSQDANTPGAFVSFSLDPEETLNDARVSHGRFVDELLTILSDATVFGTGLEDIDPAELQESWVFWHHDRALLGSQIPSPQDLSNANQRALSQLVDVLGLRQPPQAALASSEPKLSRSGATDEGWFILTPDVARLFSVSSSVLYVFGRKGTGKTRLVRELHSSGLGEPLLVAADYAFGGLPSGGSSFRSLLLASKGNLDIFWWALLRLALEVPSTDDPSFLEKISTTVEQLTASEFEEFALPREVESRATALQQRRVFLIDGVETAVPASELRAFVESVFRFMSAVQYNRILSSKVTVRLFLRSDLARGASQNVEQQVDGNDIHLRWDKPAILNFALARLASLEWFKTTFHAVCADVYSKRDLIARGALPEEDAEALLLRVFPKSLERNKLKTTTFFSTYFSDAGGDTEGKASFYPRLFDGFLRDIDEKARNGQGATRKPVDGDRLNSSFVLQAYDEASARFIDEVRTELYALLDFDKTMTRNQQAVDRLIDAFAGLKTPFVFEEMVHTLAERAGLAKDATREALRAMKSMGLFEDRPGYPGSWRTGRLYKAGLRMKYVR